MTAEELDQKAKKLAKEYIHLEKELLDVIIELDQSKAFYQLGYSSLFRYITEALKLSPAITYNFISVARKSIEVPELKKQVETGKLSIYKAQKMTPVLTQENHKKWFELAQNKSHRELEREVAIVSPKNAVREKLQFIDSQECLKETVKIKKEVPRLQLQMGLSEELMLKFRRAQDLESQRNRKNLNLEETLEQILNLYLEKRDPLKKASRQKAKGKLKDKLQNSSREELEEESTKRTALSAKLIHQVQLRDGGECTYRNQKGQKCSSQRYLEIHHIQPVSKGGKNTLENLTLLCSGHHKVLHSR